MTHTTIRTHQAETGDFFTVEVAPSEDEKVLTVGLGRGSGGATRGQEVTVDFTVADAEATIDHLQQAVHEARRRGLVPSKAPQEPAPEGVLPTWFPNRIGGQGGGILMNADDAGFS